MIGSAGSEEDEREESCVSILLLVLEVEGSHIISAAVARGIAAFDAGFRPISISWVLTVEECTDAPEVALCAAISNCCEYKWDSAKVDGFSTINSACFIDTATTVLPLLRSALTEEEEEEEEEEEGGAACCAMIRS